MKKLLVTGSSGMLGSNILTELNDGYEVYGFDSYIADSKIKNRFEIDMTNSSQLRDMVKEIAPQMIIHCAAMTGVDQCEKDYFEAYKINAAATKDLLAAAGPRTRFIYISTDSVFDGSRGGYAETDVPSPLNNYARTKLEGEWFVEQMSADYVIIRTNMFGWNLVRGCSFAEWIFTNLSKGRQINMFTDVVFSPVSIYTLCCYIDKLLKSDFIGRLNIGTKDSLSKYEFGCRLAKLFGFDASLIKKTGSDSFGFAAKRPKDTHLDVRRAQKLFGPMPEINDELNKFYERRPDGDEKHD
jgi:dTDP-4-dehydrorhamnose reductase